MTTPAATLSCALTVASQGLSLHIEDRRPDALGLFGELSERQREQLAIDAWAIGLRALMNAHAQAQEARLEDVGRSVLEDVQQKLEAFLRLQQEALEGELRRYFDPSEGRLVQRLEALVGGEGDLAELLGRFVGPQNSVLAEALARQVGETSPLLRRLSPTESEGVVQAIGRHVAQAFESNRSTLQAALDPLRPDSAVARFLAALKADLQRAGQDREKQMAGALKALDANDPGSLLSNLVKHTQRATETVLAAINPANPSSALATLRTALTEMLSEHIRATRELHEFQLQRQARFESEVKEALVRLETRRREAARSASGGLEFEDAVIASLERFLRGGPYLLDVSRNTPGQSTTRKVGDAVVSFTQDSAYAGSSVVVECKRREGVTTVKALAELEMARVTRRADVGLFILASSHAREDFPALARYGKNVLMIWDPEDPALEIRLHAALLLALGLAAHRAEAPAAANVAAVQGMEHTLQAELDRLEKMRKASDGIRKHNEGLAKELQAAERSLERLLEQAAETLKALHLEAGSEAERKAPVALAGPTAIQSRTTAA